MLKVRVLPVAVLTLALGATPGAGQDRPPPTQPATAQAPARAQQDSGLTLNRAQPDFTLVNLPTGLRLPRGKSAFRVTHRFLRALDQGDFGDLLEDFFGFDSGALIGLEYRYGVLPGGQVGIYRTSNKTIQFFAQYDVYEQRDDMPVGVAALAAIAGTNNFRDSYMPSLGAVVSRLFGDVAAVYAEPMWVNNTHALPRKLVDHNGTFMIGLGARVRIRPTLYLVAEASPRVAGFDPGHAVKAFALEKRWGGHVFQMNFSNSFATSLAEIARAGFQTTPVGRVHNDWFIGFNISRKFYLQRLPPQRP